MGSKAYIFICAFFLLLFSNGFAQIDDREAEEHYKHNNFLMAIPVYKNLLKLERDHVGYSYKLGLCYLKTNVDKTHAIPYLEKAYKAGKYPHDLPYYLAYAYALDYRFDDALKILEEHKGKASGKDKDMMAKLAEDCKMAKELIKKPISVSFENLGDKLNTEYPDYYPFVSADETFIAFNSRRKTSKNKLEEDGYYNCDIYTSSFNGSEYTSAVLAQGVNSATDDQVVGISPTGEVVFIFSQAQEIYGALYTVKRNGSILGKKEKFTTSVNDEKSIEISGFMSADGQVVFFASNRAGGYGGYDIWMVRHLPNGTWAIPQNCGPLINTPGDEDFPSISYDGRTIYFSSNGHVGMGGFDIYQVTWNVEGNEFSDCKNLGYPLNTPFDERTISYTEDGKHAYISTARKGGKGDLDIYRVTFDAVEITPAIFNIKLQSGIADKPYLTEGVIIVFNQKNEPIGEYRPNAAGKFTIALGPGVYDIQVDSPGYKQTRSQLKVNEFTMRMGIIDSEIKLTKN
ncbi:MAG TPA: hypothetical protein VD905_20240 [Flavobacteriales bacterium]|nr:hypothetical protein [Flavobacteriales bacterium]